MRVVDTHHADEFGGNLQPMFQLEDPIATVTSAENNNPYQPGAGTASGTQFKLTSAFSQNNM